MNHYDIERRGGLAGLKASGTVDADALDPKDREALDALLDGEATLAPDPGADRYTYVVTRTGSLGRTTREIPESMIPPGVARVVREQI